MAEEKNYTQIPQDEEEMEIDLMEYARKLWAARKLLLKVIGIATIVGLIIAFTTPKKYTVNVTLAPELGNSRNSRSLSNLASMLGMNNMSNGADADAIGVMLYPDVISSTPFIVDLMDTPIKTLDTEEADTTFSVYLKGNKSSLIGTIMSLPSRAIGGIISLLKSDEEQDSTHITDPFQLTKGEAMVVNALRKMIVSSVDKKTGVTSISVTMQDPLVAAIIADTLLYKLKEHIINYRVAKVSEDCKYYEKMFNESKQKYNKAQENYAKYVDANKNIILHSVMVEQQRLQNEVSLAYNIYNQNATLYQTTLAKVQEEKPMFAIIEPPTVPLQPSGTSRKMILIGIVFLAFAGTAAWILFGKDFLFKIKDEFKKDPSKTTEPSNE